MRSESAARARRDAAFEEKKKEEGAIPLPPLLLMQRTFEDKPGVVHVRFVGWYYRIRFAFLIFQIAVWIGILLFHDSILAYIGEQVGRNAATFMGGAWRGLRN